MYVVTSAGVLTGVWVCWEMCINICGYVSGFVCKVSVHARVRV